MPFTRLKIMWYAITSYFNSRCQHPFWRAAIKDHAPAKWCSQCGIVVEITEEEFHARFKRPSYALRERA